MADETREHQNIQAGDNSVAAGNISIQGPVGGNFVIGNTGFTAGQVEALITQISTTFQPRPFDGRCPYKGLDYFEEEDAGLFFGREKLVEGLGSRLKGSQTLFVTGPSGSGKSSLVRAGLIHALKQGCLQDSERWLYGIMKPGREPVTELARVTAKLAGSLNAADEISARAATDPTIFRRWCEIALGDNKGQRAVLFIDQFEEVFTQINREMAGLLIDLLENAASQENGRVILLFAMRSDFVSNCAAFPKLNALLNRQFVQIGAMQPEELVSAIAQPALRVGLRIDPDLIAQIINDMRGEPGALPLMQFALKDLFDAQHARGGAIALTLSDYLQRGGIRKALERHADDSFNRLDSHEQALARSIFSSLIEIGRGTQDTRRTAVFEELVPAGAASEEVEAIVHKLADARLVTTDEVAGKDTVTISHEKLIEAWPWLKKLVDENRDVIALQNQIAADAMEWEEHRRDASYLYSGARLANVNEQMKANNLVLSGTTLAYIKAAQKRRRRGLSTRVISFLLIAVIVYLLFVMGFPVILAGIARPQALGEMVAIPAGPAVFGTDNPDFIDLGIAAPVSSASLPAFAIGKYEVTNYQYSLCVTYGNCSVPHDQFEFQDGAKGNYPVVNIQIYQANAFCQWLGQRLPTQHEWERAARGPDGRPWPWGNQEPVPATANMPWNNHTALGLAPVDSHPEGASPEGVYNLVGNASEWTSSFLETDTKMMATWNGSPETYIGVKPYSVGGGSWQERVNGAYIFSLVNGTTAQGDRGFRCASDVK